MQYLLSIYFNN